MFTIDYDDSNSNATLRIYPRGQSADPDDSGTHVGNREDLATLIQAKPGEWSVTLWNHLPGVTPINTPKFRNRSTAIERIWGKLCELYPDAVPSDEMPKAKERNVHQDRPERKRGTGTSLPRSRASASRKASDRSKHPNRPNGAARSSAWATELTEALRKRFNPGEDFALEDVYKLIPVFQRRHKENHHIAARLRTTLAQDLRGQGVVKSLKRGQYRMLSV